MRRIDWFLLPLCVSLLLLLLLRLLKTRALTPSLLRSFLLTQTLQYLDKTALNYAKVSADRTRALADRYQTPPSCFQVFGMDKAMGLTSSQYSWTASIFYLGYLVAQEPAAYLIGRFKSNRVLGGTCVIWGGMVLAMLGCRSFAAAMAVRFLLGTRL